MYGMVHHHTAYTGVLFIKIKVSLALTSAFFSVQACSTLEWLTFNLLLTHLYFSSRKICCPDH